MPNFIIVIFLLLAIFFPQMTYAQIPSGVGIGFDQILGAISNFGNYFYSAALIIASITLVWAGIIFFSAGADTARAKKAKDIFKNGIIGVIILSGIGTIMVTAQFFACNPAGFFGGGGAGCASGPSGAGSPGPQLSTYGCNAQNTCVQMVGGLFPDSSCSNYCSSSAGPSAQASNDCSECVDDGLGNPTGATYCLADMSTVSNPCYAVETDCQGVFTKVAGGCP